MCKIVQHIQNDKKSIYHFSISFPSYPPRRRFCLDPLCISPSNAEPTHRAGEDALRTLVSSNFSAFTYLCRCDLKDLSKTSLWCLNVRWYQPYEFMWDSGWEKIHKNIYNIFKCLACRALKVQSPSESLRSKSVISPEQTSPESATLGSGSLHDKCR